MNKSAVCVGIGSFEPPDDLGSTLLFVCVHELEAKKFLAKMQIVRVLSKIATEHTEINWIGSTVDSTTTLSDQLTQKIIGAAVEVHKSLGPGLLESIYEEALSFELDLRGISYARQVGVDIVYKGRVIKGQRIDIIVEREVVIEIKSLSRMPDIVIAQILSYLKATGLKRGLIINFGEKRLVDGIRRVSN